MKIVLDTSVIVAGLRSEAGASRAILHMVYQDRLIPLVSTTLFLEYEDVLTRQDFLDKAGLGFQDVRRFLGAFARIAQPVTIDLSWRPVSRDPDDDRVLDCAINGGAAIIVIHNVRDLDIASRFGIEVLRPGNLLWRFRR